MSNNNLLTTSRIFDDYNYNYKLDFLTKFNVTNNLVLTKFTKISLNFSFKKINFDKKKMILFSELSF